MPTGVYKRIKLVSEETKRKMSLARKGHFVSDETRKKIGLKNSIKMKGKRNSPKTEFKKGHALTLGVPAPWARNNPQVFKKGLIPWNKGKKGLQKHTIEHRKALSEKLKGEKNHSWKGGVSNLHKTERNLLMNTVEYKLWRKSVFERDNYTCIFCGQRGRELNADHIKPWVLFPELRFAIDNGRTLCVPCHKSTDTYGSKAKKGQIISERNLNRV